MTDPLDTIEAILDQHPPNFRDWTNEDLRANLRALEMWEAEAASRPRDLARLKRINAIAPRLIRAGGQA